MLGILKTSRMKEGKGEEEDRKKGSREEERKKEVKEGGREEGREERRKKIDLGQYLKALTFQTRHYTDIKIHKMLDIMKPNPASVS